MLLRPLRRGPFSGIGTRSSVLPLLLWYRRFQVVLGTGISTVKHLAFPMVLTGAWESQVMTEEQMKQLHVGLQRMGKQFILDTLLDSNVLHNCVKFFPSAIMALIFVSFHYRLHLIVCRSHLRRTVACYLPLQSMPLAFLYCARLRPRSSAESASVVFMQCVSPSDPR